jgi:hypothetical protein
VIQFADPSSAWEYYRLVESFARASPASAKEQDMIGHEDSFGRFGEAADAAVTYGGVGTTTSVEQERVYPPVPSLPTFSNVVGILPPASAGPGFRMASTSSLDNTSWSRNSYRRSLRRQQFS